MKFNHIHIPGSSRELTCLPFGKAFLDEKAQFVSLARSRCFQDIRSSVFFCCLTIFANGSTIWFCF